MKKKEKKELELPEFPLPSSSSILSDRSSEIHLFLSKFKLPAGCVEGDGR